MREQPVNIQRQRIFMCVAGVGLCGFSVGMFRTAALGVDPFTSMMTGLNTVIPLSYGTLDVIVNVLLLTFSLVFDRSKIGLGTIINLTLLGYIAEYSQYLLEYLLGPLSLPGRGILLLAGILVLCFSSAMYFNANLGVSTYDAIALVASERQTKISFKFCRMAGDVTCVVIAAILLRAAGYTYAEMTAWIGIATIIIAFFMGPLISFFSKRLPDPGHAPS